MKNLIPKYLINIAELEESIKNELKIKIKCVCENKTFIIFKNLKTEKDLKTEKELEIKYKIYNEFYRDTNNNKVYVVKRNFFGKIVDKIEQPKLPIASNLQIIKVRCAKCGKEHIIFDNRQYGYDGVIEENRNLDCNDIEFSQIKTKAFSCPVEISVNILNDLTYQEFIDSVGDGFNQDDYSNAFSSIDIYAIKNGKRVRIFSCETA